MSDPAIRATGLSKSYRISSVHGNISGQRSLAEMITSTLRGRHANDPATEEFWALTDLNFEIREGEVVGLIGRNGAGKSTLLKILSRITLPTTGTAEIYGRVGSLLEVGTGFHPELSGRENVFLNGAVLGMKQREIQSRFDEIVAFAEVEQFIDTPVKRYSSGMYVRLAFAVAAHLEPDILIVDEVLSVGDLAFQQKSLGKIGEVTRQGRTVLLVTHSLVTIQSLCDSAILLEKGKLVQQATPAEVVARYLSMLGAGDNTSEWSADSNNRDNTIIHFLAASVTTADGRPGPAFDAHDDLAFTIEYVVREPVQGSAITLQFGQRGNIFTTTFDTDEDQMVLKLRSPGRYRAQVLLPGGFLRAGGYDVTLMSHIINHKFIERFERALHFSIETDRHASTFSSSFPGRPGTINIPFVWSSRRDLTA